MKPHVLYHHWSPLNIVMQADDEYFDEIDDCFKRIPAGWVGRLAVAVVPYHLHIRGPLVRMSEAIHPSLFRETYGIEKPPEISDEEFRLIGYRSRNDYIRCAT